MRNKPHIRNRYVLIGDLFLIPVAVFASYVLRLEPGPALMLYLPSALWMAGLALAIKPFVYSFFGLYRRLWLYASVQELKLIVTAVTAATLLLAIPVVSLFALGIFTGFPRSVLIIDWLLSIFLVGGLRFAVRLLAENISQNAAAGQAGRNKATLIAGAGDAGALVVRELQKNPQLGLTAVAFLDDNPEKQNQSIHGIPVVGKVVDLDKVLENLQVDEVIIAIPSAPGRIVRLVADVCRQRGVPFRTMPGIYELLGGKVSISRLREVDITDLLRREPARILDSQVGTIISGRSVLVTGAGGSIGSELCRQIARWGPSELILLGHGENTIFETLLELQESFPNVVFQPVICDIRDIMRIKNVMQSYRPQVIFHAAAHKHVPLMEFNVEEAVTNNILGTWNVVETALQIDIEQLVMISTDKAIRPVNVMGATKRIAELIVLDAADRTGKPFSVVRFGNVLGSRGSVVPLFKRQISRGGPVTITHPDMKRYFMTIPEAVHLVLQAAGLGKHGETYILNMGQSIRILDLAEDLIRLSGLTPGRDIEIAFTGIRPGEKLNEDLWDEGQLFLPTQHPDIFRMEDQENIGGDGLRILVDELVRLANEGDPRSIIAILDEVIPDAAIQSTPPPEITSI